MKGQVSKGAAAIIILVAVVVLVWFGWRTVGSSGAVQMDEETAFRAAEKKAKMNGVALRTIPQWAGTYYKYHPEEKPADASAPNPGGPPVTSLPPGAAAAPSNGGAPPPPIMH